MTNAPAITVSSIRKRAAAGGAQSIRILQRNDQARAAAFGKVSVSANVPHIRLKLPYHASKQVTNPGIGVRFVTVRGHRGR